MTPPNPTRLMVAVLSVLMLTCVPAARAKGGPRVTIGVYGDSVAEGYEIPRFLSESLVPQLRTGTARAGGFELGGTGFIPASPFRWRFNHYTLNGLEKPRLGAWVLFGNSSEDAFGFHASDALDGPSGYSGIALSPEATASAPIDGPFVAVLFTKFAGAGVFTVTAGSATFSINASSNGPPAPTQQWITVPPGTRSITVHGPSSGSVIFNGVIVRGPVNPGHIGIEVENLGHRGHPLAEDSAPRILASLTQQRFDVSVFLSAYIWELVAAGGDKRVEAGYARELRARVRLVRRYGGLCLIVDPSPLPLSPSLIARFAAIDRRVAGEQGCAYTGALARLWNPATAVRAGFTLIDGVHPRAPGYRLMAQALVPQLVKLVRERVRTRHGG